MKLFGLDPSSKPKGFYENYDFRKINDTILQESITIQSITKLGYQFQSLQKVLGEND